MRVLAFDTALGACAAAVWDAAAQTILAQESEAMARGHAEALLPMIERVMAAVDGGFASIDRIAVTRGPGSYTGIRVGVSAARAFTLALEKPAVGVSTLAALAAPLIAARQTGVIAAAIDARHGEVYLQVVNHHGQPMVAARQVSLREAARLIGAGPIRLTGSAAPALAVEAWTIGLEAQVVDAPAAPGIEWVARLGALADPAESPARPLYLKAPDAKPQGGARVALAS